ncbi:MAG: hypothetical protein AAGE94_03840, partial [Acidobacteriota bacterium]
MVSGESLDLQRARQLGHRVDQGWTRRRSDLVSTVGSEARPGSIRRAESETLAEVSQLLREHTATAEDVLATNHEAQERLAGEGATASRLTPAMTSLGVEVEF